ncbi:MAG: hypothetical protein IJL48_12015 [Bacteroidales bacterium]|nr:hypothetical protein [Bacteroidales bacterium]
MIDISEQTEWSDAGVTPETERRQSRKKEAAGGSGGMLSVQSARRSVMLYFF